MGDGRCTCWRLGVKDAFLQSRGSGFKPFDFRFLHSNVQLVMNMQTILSLKLAYILAVYSARKMSLAREIDNSVRVRTFNMHSIRGAIGEGTIRTADFNLQSSQW